MRTISRNAPVHRPVRTRVTDGLSRSLLADVVWLVGRMRLYLEAHRKAQAATHMHALLSRMSDRDLARHGLRRADIAAYIRDRLG